MRTNIDIDDALLSEAMKTTGLPSKKATVEKALEALVLEGRRRRALEELLGIGWDGDLQTMRGEWCFEPER